MQEVFSFAENGRNSPVMIMLTGYCSSVSYDTCNETEGREARWLQSFPAFSPLKTVHLACLKRREKKPPFFVVATSGLCESPIDGTVSPVFSILHSEPSSSQ